MSVTIFLEGGAIGPHSKALNTECRKGFRELLDKCGFERMPALLACGGRTNAFRDFKKQLKRQSKAGFVVLWVDSEDPVENIEKTWSQLKNRPGDNWTKPRGATDEQVLLMTTCMETLIVADRLALQMHYGAKLNESALPPLVNLESRHRDEVLDRLEKATGECPNKYTKGKRSFEILGKLNPDTLEQLPSFKRARRILEAKL